MSFVLSFFGMLWTVFKWPLYALLAVSAFFGLLCLVYAFLAHRSGARLQKGEHNRPEKVPIWKNFFYYLPKQYVTDIYNRNPEFFRYQGCVIFTGRQGYGKTIAMAQQALAWRKEYPKAKCITNFALSGEDAKLNDWRLLVGYKNGIQGVIACIDEMQNWFSSNQSKNFHLRCWKLSRRTGKTAVLSWVRPRVSTALQSPSVSKQRKSVSAILSSAA